MESHWVKWPVALMHVTRSFRCFAGPDKVAELVVQGLGAGKAGGGKQAEGG